MSGISQRERLVTAIIWANGPISSPEVLARLSAEHGIDTVPKGATKTCEALVHKGLAKRTLTTRGYVFSPTPYGEEIACKYLLKAEAAAK